ncbi:MAG: diacylglycerol kinase family lipid kinase [Planctomycetes bacterium]|nr:diacylglycerol kinase family lipid kinase [Planctomycetota bacterium]
MTADRTSSPPEALPPHKTRVAILANPHAGTGKSHRLVEALVGALRGHGFAPHLCWQREELTELVRGAAEELRCVVAAGGDGTLLEVLNRAPGLPVTILPLGNENLVARFCRLKRSARKTADVVAAGRLRRTDLARVNGRLFCLMAGVGFDAEVVHRVHERRRGHINKLSYALPILQAMGSYSYPMIEAEVEETGERLRGAMAFVFNIPQYALGLPVARGADPADGQLDLYVFERPGLIHLARYLLAILSGQQHRLPDFQHRSVRSVRLSSDRRAPLQIDGDPAGWLPASLEIVPQSLTLVVGDQR